MTITDDGQTLTIVLPTDQGGSACFTLGAKMQACVNIHDNKNTPAELRTAAETAVHMALEVAYPLLDAEGLLDEVIRDAARDGHE